MKPLAWLLKAKAPATLRQKSALQRPSLFLLAGAGLLLLGMLVGFYLFFPAEALRLRIIQEVLTRTGAQLQIEQVALYPLLTLDANQIELSVTALPQPLEIERLSIAPQWLTLLSGDPGALLQARVMSGTVTTGLRKSGAINSRATGLRFELPLQTPVPFNVIGTLNEANLDSSVGLAAESRTSLSLSLADVKVLGLEIFPAESRGLFLGEITVELDGQGRAMRINNLTAKGGDLEVNGDGTLQIGRSAATSRFKLALQVRPGPSADPNLTTLLELAGSPAADGRYSFQLSGTLAQPVLKSGG